MSLSMILALTVCPAMLGIQESIRESQAKSRREQRRAQRCNLVVNCVKRSVRSRDIDNRMIVLRDDNVSPHLATPQELTALIALIIALRRHERSSS
jgi:hypothetical protein